MAKNRTEIDKELMYRKIMPTAAGKPVEKPKQQASEEMAEAQPLFPTATGMAKTLRRPVVPLPFREEHETVITNLMEELVMERLDATLVRFNCCKCNRCKKDIAALALNRLTPRYVVIRQDDEGRRKKAGEEYGSEVTSALVQAILLVKKEPRH